MPRNAKCRRVCQMPAHCRFAPEQPTAKAPLSLTVEEYEVEITQVLSETGNRNLLLTVTDPKLLETTGGIVQGMSGSPILQNGKFVGAVTHVLLNDPTSGYGIFLENMVEAVWGE